MTTYRIPVAAATAAIFSMAAGPAHAQGAGFQRLVTGQSFPLTRKLKELNTGWQRMELTLAGGKPGADPLSAMMPAITASMQGDAKGAKGKPDEAASAAIGMSFLSAMMGGGAQAPGYYTQGETLQLGTETFLVTYHYEKPGMDVGALMAAGAAGGEPDFGALFGGGAITDDTNLSLSLVNVRAIQTIQGIRPFSLEEEKKALSGSSSFMDLIRSAMQEEAKATDASKPIVPKPIGRPAPKAPPRRK